MKLVMGDFYKIRTTHRRYCNDKEKAVWVDAMFIGKCGDRYVFHTREGVELGININEADENIVYVTV